MHMLLIFACLRMLLTGYVFMYTFWHAWWDPHPFSILKFDHNSIFSIENSILSSPLGHSVIYKDNLLSLQIYHLCILLSLPMTNLKPL